MKIKTVKKLNLHELIKYVWDNKVYPSVWKSEESPSDGWTMQFFEDGLFRSYKAFHDDDTFTVEVEEELTEDTEFDSLWELYYDTINKKPRTYVNFHTSVSKILNENSIDGDNITLAIYYGSTLIWAKDLGIPESGVLEVD